MNVHQLFENARDNARNIFNQQHSLTPIWHAITSNNENILIATPWADNYEKDAALYALRQLFAEKDVQRFAFVVEAWTVCLNPEETNTVTSDGEYTGPPPSEHPDRREVLRVTAEDRDGTVLSGQFYILRPEHGPPKLSEFHKDEPFDAIAGRMTGLLKPEKRSIH